MSLLHCYPNPSCIVNTTEINYPILLQLFASIYIVLPFNELNKGNRKMIPQTRDALTFEM